VNIPLVWKTIEAGEKASYQIRQERESHRSSERKERNEEKNEKNGAMYGGNVYPSTENENCIVGRP